HHKSHTLEVTEHSRGPPGPGGRLSDGQFIHAANLNTSVSRRRRTLPPVPVLEPDDVVQLGRRDLDDRRVLERRDAMDSPRPKVEAGASCNDLNTQDRVAGRPELELRTTRLDEPGLVLLPVELERERLAGTDEEDLADVRLRLREDELVPPRFFDAARLECPRVEAPEARGVDGHPGDSTLRCDSSWGNLPVPPDPLHRSVARTERSAFDSWQASA